MAVRSLSSVAGRETWCWRWFEKSISRPPLGMSVNEPHLLSKVQSYVNSTVIVIELDGRDLLGSIFTVISLRCYEH